MIVSNLHPIMPAIVAYFDEMYNASLFDRATFATTWKAASAAVSAIVTSPFRRFSRSSTKESNAASLACRPTGAALARGIARAVQLGAAEETAKER